MEDTNNADGVAILPSGWPDDSNTQLTHDEEKRCDSVISASPQHARKPSRTNLHVSTRLSNRQESYMRMLKKFLTKEELRHIKLRDACLLWPNGTTIRWTCMNGTHYDQQFISEVLCEGQAWTYGANLAFQYRWNDLNRKPRRTEVRVEFKSKGDPHSKFGIYGTYVPRNSPTMWLNEGCDAETIAHEFGHAIGLGHEHQRWISDIEFDLEHARAQIKRRDEAAGTKEYQSENDPDSQIFSKDDCTRIDPFEYDPNSVMHYDLGYLEDAAFKSQRPQDKIIARSYDHDGVGFKDRKLVGYLYPLPTGGTVRPYGIRQTGTKVPKSQLQAVLLPHVWSTPCRAMVGINELAWCSRNETCSVKARVAARSQTCFHLDTVGDNMRMGLSYLAVDPATAHLQISSHKTYRSRLQYKSIDPVADHSWEHHRLRWDTSSKAKILTWINELQLAANAQNFELSVDHNMTLSWEKKRVGVHVRSTGGAKASVNWIVINPHAINIDGGHRSWHASNGKRKREGRVHWKEGLFGDLGHRLPKVMVGVNGLKHQRCKAHGLTDEVWFKVEVIDVDVDGFEWEVHTCHDECFSELSCSWIVVPPVFLNFGLPKGDKKPRRLPAPRFNVKKRNQHPEVEDAFDELGALFGEKYEGSLHASSDSNNKLGAKWSGMRDGLKALFKPF